jgi:capsular polysaccharide biosynthesis protein
MNQNKLTKPENIIDDIIKNKLIVFLIIFLFLLVATFLTALQKKEYSSTSQVLIIQEQEQKMDAYLASKSSESLAKNLRKAISTSSFRNKVLENMDDLGLNISKTEKSRRKEWLETVNVKIIPNTSILEIKSYHISAFQSEKILNKILNTLLENHQLYHGGGDDIRLEVINNPLTSNRPTRPNWPLNLFLSLILAVFFIITLLVLFPNKVNFFDKKLQKKNPAEKNKRINEKKGNFKVYDYLSATPKGKVELPADLFEEEKEDTEIKEEGFFAEDNANYEQKKEADETNTIELENNAEIKEIIGNNHYLKRKD